MRKNPNTTIVILLSSLIRRFLNLRYRAILKNDSLIKESGPILFLSNHQALVDPAITVTQVLRFNYISPVIVDTFYRLPIINTLMKLLEAVPVTDLRRKRDPSVLNHIYKHVHAAFSDNRNVILYPSGELCSSCYERIANKKSAFNLTSSLQDNVKVYGVRVRGLWGSRWSKYRTGNTPNFLFVGIKSVLYILANFIFLMPKRNVYIEFVDITEQAKLMAKEDKQKFNSYLEDFFNKGHEEKALFETPLFFIPKSKRSRKEK